MSRAGCGSVIEPAGWRQAPVIARLHGSLRGSGLDGAVDAAARARSRCTTCCPGGPGTRARNFTSTRPVTGSSWRCLRSPGSMPKRWARWQACSAMRRLSAAPFKIIHWASPRFGAPLAAWGDVPPASRRVARGHCGTRREKLFGHAGWRALHPGGPPFTCADYRVFVTVCVAGLPGPASETALGSFRRALEGTLASAGAHARRLEPDALLSLAAELIAPRVGKAWGDTAHAPGCGPCGAGRPGTRSICNALLPDGRCTVDCRTRSCFTTPTETDVAVRVLTALAFPDVWPGWRGNALMGDFHRDFLQPGCPVLTCLTVMTGDAADGEKAFLKSARATQQAGTGIARYLAGPAGKGERLAVRHRTPERRGAAREGVLPRGRLLPRRCHRRGRAGGARHLSRPGVESRGRAFFATALLARVFADALGRRPRHRPVAYGANEDASECVRCQPRRRCTGNGGASGWIRTTRRCCSCWAAGGSPRAGRRSPTTPAITTSPSPENRVPENRCSCRNWSRAW